MSRKTKTTTTKEVGKPALTPKLRFPEFRDAEGWHATPGDELFEQINNRQAHAGLPVLAITQEHGAIPRDAIDYHVSVTDKSVETYKEVQPGDFIISLRSFQGGIEYSEYHGICSPAYVILRKRAELSDQFFKPLFKSHSFIQQLTKNLEGLRDGKMISYKQFSELLLPNPTQPEQQKLAECLSSVDEVIAAQSRKLDAFKTHKKGLMQELFPREGETQPRLRFPEFQDAPEWVEIDLGDVSSHFKGFAFKSKDYTTCGRRIVRVSDMGFDYIKDETSAIYIKEAKPYEKWKLLKDDLIITTVGSKPPAYDSLVGRTIVVKSKDEGSLLNQNAVCLRANKNIEQGFLNIVFKREAYVSFIESVIRGNANQGSIALLDLFKYIIFKPKPKEQQRIADCLTSLDELIAVQAQKLEALKTHKKGLMQQLFPSPEEEV